MTYAITGRCKPVIRLLEQHGARCLTIAPNTVLPEPVREHADMLVYDDGGELLTYDASLADTLRLYGVACTCPSIPLERDYPGCVRLNCLRVGGYLLANTKACAPEVLDSAHNQGLEIVHVRQGYARCSTAVLDDRAVITADSGIADSLSIRGVEVLRITPGHISLPGYDYGFIGGCCVRLGDAMIVCGDIHRHPDGGQMIEFIESRGLRVECAGDGELFDFGGAVVITR